MKNSMTEPIEDYVPFEQSGLACKPTQPYDYRDSWMKEGLVIPIAGEKKSLSQKMREAGYTRRPTWRSLPSDE